MEGALSRRDDDNNNNNTGGKDCEVLLRRLIATALARRVHVCCGWHSLAGDVEAMCHLLDTYGADLMAAIIRTTNGAGP